MLLVIYTKFIVSNQKKTEARKKIQRIFSFYLGHFSGSIDAVNINRWTHFSENFVIDHLKIDDMFALCACDRLCVRFLLVCVRVYNV